MKNVYVSFAQSGVPGSEAVYLEAIAREINTAMQAPKPFCMFYRDQVGAVRVLIEDGDPSATASVAAAQGVYNISGQDVFKAVEIDSTGTRTELADPVIVPN